MRIRYRQDPKGIKAVVKVYSLEELNLNASDLDSDAVEIITRLNERGFESYIVGGAVRDLLLGRKPKDFDVVTSASPRQINKYIYNSRIIGKRFRIVHVAFKEKIIEVSTFRSKKKYSEKYNVAKYAKTIKETERKDTVLTADYEHKKNSNIFYDNNYGTIEEDAKRRDFSINSLYLNPLDKTVLDFNNALKDFKNKKIVSLIPLSYSFKEDPVRMIRALKYKVTTGFNLSLPVSFAIHRFAHLLQYVSKSRLTEELNKILCTGCCTDIFKELKKYGLLFYLLPSYAQYIGKKDVLSSLSELDCQIRLHRENPNNNAMPDLSVQYFYLCFPHLFINEEDLSSEEIYSNVFKQLRMLISPNTPPNIILERTVQLFMETNHISLPHKARKQFPKKVSNSKRRKHSKKKRKINEQL